MAKCLMEKCEKPANPDFRGLCMKHYTQAKNLVSDKVTTWEELEAKGLAAPAPKDVRADENSVAAVLMQRRAKPNG